MMRARRHGGLLVAPLLRSRRRGAAFLFFLLVALPLMTFGSVLAIDVTRMIVAAREASNVTEAAAVAGAQQFRPNYWSLDTARARQMAESSVDFSTQPDVGAMNSEVNRRVAVVSRPNSSYEGERVTVTVDYTVRGLVFMPLLSLLTSSDNDATSMEFSVTRSADVCIPGRYDPTGGSCVRPVP